jgi:hypothetical protein
MWIKGLGEFSLQIPFYPIIYERNQIFASIRELFCLLSFVLDLDRLMQSRDVDTLLEKLSRNYELSRIKSIGGAAQVNLTPLSQIMPLINSFCSMLLYGGNQQPYLRFHRWIRTFRFTIISLLTLFLFQIRPQPKTPPLIPMLWHSKLF